MQRRTVLQFSLVLTLFASGVYFWLKADAPAKQPAPRRFESYRRDFRKPDGSLPNDTELMNQLIAKGIPIAAEPDCAESPQGCHAQSPEPSVKASIQFAPGIFSSDHQRAISEKTAAILEQNAASMFRSFEGILLQRAQVTAEKKIQLYFNAEFAKLASDEGMLTEFSESLAALNGTGIKGAEIFIQNKRLGEFMRELDTRRDREALQSQPAGSENRSSRR